MVSLRKGVRVTGLRPEVLLAIMVAERAYSAAGRKLVITSCVDGTHSAGSFHYSGAAVDLRISHVIPSMLSGLVDRIRTALGADYDVVLESDHLHIEFQPKQPLCA